MKRFLFWSPRLLCILFALFISLFALDEFGTGLGFWQSVLAITMHLVPTAIIILLLAVSWRWELIGGILFLALAVLYVVMAWGKFGLAAYVLISGPMIIISMLFFVNWKFRTRPKRITKSPPEKSR
jgi:hypothetical protein